MNPAIVNDVKAILHEARSQAYTAINSAMVQAYWLVEKRIVAEEQGGEAKAKYGEAVLKELSKSLSGYLG